MAPNIITSSLNIVTFFLEELNSTIELEDNIYITILVILASILVLVYRKYKARFKS
jgi:hypothetical protein